MQGRSNNKDGVTKTGDFSQKSWERAKSFMRKDKESHEEAI